MMKSLAWDEEGIWIDEQPINIRFAVGIVIVSKSTFENRVMLKELDDKGKLWVTHKQDEDKDYEESDLKVRKMEFDGSLSKDIASYVYLDVQ
ncbi:hypothetical protein KIN20_031087 [Parelaphostrongylus tenuis]|uniref:Uncharacterized protein n=1 Tax=Parelaphostrongylus tenuis TaxID=148309 RepID=A0AAD5R4M6_PARTN|nr:hypothetical protein KIN20_031087 [Parelaphostrongylus tenuis]